MPAPRPPLQDAFSQASSVLAEPLPDADDGELLPASDDGSVATATDVGSSGKRKKTRPSIKKTCDGEKIAAVFDL